MSALGGSLTSLFVCSLLCQVSMRLKFSGYISQKNKLASCGWGRKGKSSSCIECVEIGSYYCIRRVLPLVPQFYSHTSHSTFVVAGAPSPEPPGLSREVQISLLLLYTVPLGRSYTPFLFILSSRAVLRLA